MKLRISVINVLIIVLSSLITAAPIALPRDEWQRVVTGADFIIDIGTTSLVLLPNRTFSARFKTTLSKSEDISAKAGAKYRIRIETIQFRSNDRQYRITESTLLDSSGKIVFSSPADEEKVWKDMIGPTTSRIFNAARALPPFGAWKVISYRYVEGDQAVTIDPPDLKNLVGNNFFLSFDEFRVGKAACRSPDYEMRSIGDKDFTNLTGYPLKSIAVQTDKIDALILKCESGTSFPPQSLGLRLVSGRMLMLWEGVFFELERTK